MAVIRKFEDIKVWQKSRELTRFIYELTSKGLWSQDFVLQQQIRKSSISIMSNIAEGFGRRSSVKFCRYLSIARASASKVKSQPYIALDIGYISEKIFLDVCTLIDETINLIVGFMRYFRSEALNLNQLSDSEVFI